MKKHTKPPTPSLLFVMTGANISTQGFSKKFNKNQMQPSADLISFIFLLMKFSHVSKSSEIQAIRYLCIVFQKYISDNTWVPFIS